jgi:ABC-2 type transport system permease protein
MTLKVFRASFRRALLEYLRYPSSWQKGLFWNPIQFILPFLFGLTALSGPAGANAETVGFVFVGAWCWSWLHNTLWDASALLRREFQTGTLEAVFMTPAPRTAWLVGSVSAATVVHAWALLVSGAVAYLVFPFPFNPRWDVVLLYVLIVFLLGWSLALMTAAALLYLKQANNVLSVFVDLTMTVSGATYPTASGPRWLYSLVLLMPLAPAIDGLRQAIMNGDSFDPSLAVIVGLVLGTVVMLALGLHLFRTMERQVRHNATLHIF